MMRAIANEAGGRDFALSDGVRRCHRSQDRRAFRIALETSWKRPGATRRKTRVCRISRKRLGPGDVNIAYQVVGDGPVDLVYVPGWVSHVELAWELPELAAGFERLASCSRLILFDKRGTGMSDPVPTDEPPTLEQRMDDVRAVMDAVRSERAAIFGASEGGNMSMLFAATYPERTIALCTFGSTARRLRVPDYPWAPTWEERREAIAEVERTW